MAATRHSTRPVAGCPSEISLYRARRLRGPGLHVWALGLPGPVSAPREDMLPRTSAREHMSSLGPQEGVQSYRALQWGRLDTGLLGEGRENTWRPQAKRGSCSLPLQGTEHCDPPSWT